MENTGGATGTTPQDQKICRGFSLTKGSVGCRRPFIIAEKKSGNFTSFTLEDY
jgi:hypothetical protein